MRKRIIVDFDNTMGVEGFDVDDGLALLYLLGCDDVVIEGICTTYGNSSVDVVHANTVQMLSRMGLGTALYRGGAHPDDLSNEASTFMARASAENPGCLSVVATGSLTNVRGAHEADPAFYDNLDGVYVMGGYTSSLPYHGSFIDELNMSCDPDAALDVITAVGATGAQGACPVTVATAQACLPATFSRARFEREFGRDSWLTRTCSSWFRNMEEHFDWPHAVCWDVVAAAALAQPGLFAWTELRATLYRRYLSVGYLEEAPQGAPCARIRIPVIADAVRFVDEVFGAWHRGLERLGLGLESGAR